MAECGDLFGGDLYEEEQAVELAKYIDSVKTGTPVPDTDDDQSAYVKKIHDLNAAGSYAQLLDEFIPDIQIVFDKGSDADVAGAYSILYALCRKMSEKEQAAYTDKLIASCTASKDTTSMELRLKMLVNLYNSVKPSFGPMRFSVFKATINYCVATDQVSKVGKHLGNLEGRVQSWNLNAAAQKEVVITHRVMLGAECSKAVYLMLAEALGSYQGGELGQKFLVTYLALWGGKDDLKKAAPQAITAAVKAIQNPTTFDCDELLRIPAVAALSGGDDKAKTVHRLLEIYSREKLEDYEKFVAGKSALLESIGLTNEACVDKLRMLSLASLAADESEVPYDMVKSVLKLDSDKQVELWVIKAHRAGLVQGKLDQLRRVVLVNRTTARVFSTTDWAELRTRVDGWRTCLTNMSDIIQGAKEHAEAI